MENTNQAAVAAEQNVSQPDNSVSDNIQNKVEGTDSQASTAAERKLTKKLKLKIDGQEIDEDLPFEVDETNKEQVEFLKRHLQMSKVASKRMNEAALTRKQADQFIQALQNDPMKILSNPKLMGEEKFQKIAEEFLAKKIQEQMLSPEERSRLEKEERLRKYEEQEKAVKEKEEQERIVQLQNHYQEQYTKTITQALESSNLPKNAFTIKRMAQLLQQNIKHGLELEPASLAQLVREDYQRELSSIIGNSDPGQIISMFGEDVVTKIRKHDLEKLKAQQPSYLKPFVKEEVQSQEPQKPQKWRDFNEKMKKEK